MAPFLKGNRCFLFRLNLFTAGIGRNLQKGTYGCIVILIIQNFIKILIGDFLFRYVE